MNHSAFQAKRPSALMFTSQQRQTSSGVRHATPYHNIPSQDDPQTYFLWVQILKGSGILAGQFQPSRALQNVVGGQEHLCDKDVDLN
jgi:hypothetical protein